LQLFKALLAMSALVATGVSAGLPQDPTASGTTTMPTSSVTAIIERYGDSIMSLPDVVGIGESSCNGQPCLKVLLQRDNASTRTQLSEMLDGVLVVVEITGPVRANPQ
jgi:hypothetical protein